MPMLAQKPRQIFALGGGEFGNLDDEPLIREMLRATGKERPVVCYIPTASYDPRTDIDDFYRAAKAFDIEPAHLDLLAPVAEDTHAYARRVLEGADLVFVEGGNTANMLAIWRVHGVDRLLRQAYERGVVMSGYSAGSLCWFEGGTTDSFGSRLRAISDGLGFIQGSNCPHYDGEEQRRPLYHRLVASGELPSGYAADDGVALHFIDEGFVEAVTAREFARAFTVRPDGRGGAIESECSMRLVEHESFERRAESVRAWAERMHG